MTSATLGHGARTVPEPGVSQVPRPLQGLLPRPALSSRPQAWKGIVVELFRARDVRFVARHSEHVVALQLRPERAPPRFEARRAEAYDGNIDITPAGMLREWRYPGDAEIEVLRIVPSVMEAITDDGRGGVEARALAPHSGVSDPQIAYFGARLLDELKAGGLASRACVQCIANLLAIHLLRHYTRTHAAGEEGSAKLPGHKLRQATEFISRNLCNDLSLERISETLRMSAHHFAHVFKQTTGVAPHRYVIECRMERAKVLLRDTDLRVSEIAQLVGYANQSHFSTVFRQFTGKSPLRYRDRA